MLKFKELDDKKKKMIILVTTLILFIGVSFAFIAAQLSGGIIGNANVTADTTDNLQFNVDKDIYLNPTQFNVVEGGGGLSDTAVGTASLIANSTTDEASATYSVYFRINTNEYIYTTEDNKPEIVLTITDPNGTPITSVDGLTYVTAENADGTTVSGFDITTEMGLFTIASNYGITSSSSTVATEQDWTFTVTFINLTTNQTENGGSTLDAEIILGTEERYTLANYIINNVYTGVDGENNLYYHDGSILAKSEYCLYDGNEVLSYPDITASTNEDDCNQVYLLEGKLMDASLIYNGIEQGLVEEVTWDSDNGICKTISGLQVLNDADITAVVGQEQCIGYAAKSNDVAFIIINVGSGTMDIVLDAEDYSYRYSGSNYKISDKYQNEYTDMDNLILNLKYKTVFIYKNKFYISNDEEETNKMYQLIYEDFAKEYCNVNSCDYEDILNQLVNNTIEDENITISFERFMINLQISSEFMVISYDTVINYNGEILFGVYNIYKYLSNEFCAKNSCNADEVYNDLFTGVENDLTLALNNYLDQNYNNFLENSIKLNYLLAYDTNIAFETYEEAANYAANDGIVASLNNYVCFGSSEEVCPENNLYRIIGMFNDNGEYQAKLIKATGYGEYLWDNENNNTWNASIKPDIYTTLNSTYYNSLESEWGNLISIHNWHVGGLPKRTSYNWSLKEVYNNEAGIDQSGYEETMKIGLMYISDYIYASIPNYWATTLLDFSTAPEINDEWLYVGLDEWTITPYSNDTDWVFAITIAYVAGYQAEQENVIIRPTFYLKSNVELAGGTGTQTDPYRLVV